VTTTFLAHGIPSVSASGPGEAVYRIVQDRPTLVLVGSTVPGRLSAIAKQLSLSDPYIPAISIDPETLPASLVDLIQADIESLGGVTRSTEARQPLA
jgi:hypothetical protein